MSDRSNWIALPIVRVGAPPYLYSGPDHELPKASAETYQALRAAAPLTLAEAAWALCRIHPCKPEDGDDLSLAAPMERILARLEEAADRGEISRHPTFDELERWVDAIGLPTLEDPAISRNCEGGGDSTVVEAGPGSNGVERMALSSAELDPQIQAVADEVSARLRAQGKRAPKKALVPEIRRRLDVDGLLDASIIRRFRSCR